MSCNLCGATDGQTLLYAATLPAEGASSPDSLRCTTARYGLHPPIVKCRVCGLVYVSPRRRSEVIHHNYEVVVDRDYLQEREGRVLTFRRNLRPLEELVGSPPLSPVNGGSGRNRRLLDVGCHVGVFLEIAREKGWEAWGVEPSHWAAEQAQARGLQVITGTLGEASLPAQSFDAVTMWDVIEHFTDPMAEMQEVNRVLKPGGLACIHTIDIESPLARLMGPRWPWLMEMHLYYFSPRTLTALLEKTGFRVVKTIKQGRFLRLGYLASRLAPFSQRGSRALASLIGLLGLADLPVPINLGDLFTTFARKI